MAASRSGFTLGPCPCRAIAVDVPCGWCSGVLAPVATGVVRLDGSSEVNIVALEGDMRYLAFNAASRASLKPKGTKVPQ